MSSLPEWSEKKQQLYLPSTKAFVFSSFVRDKDKNVNLGSKIHYSCRINLNKATANTTKLLGVLFFGERDKRGKCSDHSDRKL